MHRNKIIAFAFQKISISNDFFELHVIQGKVLEGNEKADIDIDLCHIYVA